MARETKAAREARLAQENGTDMNTDTIDANDTNADVDDTATSDDVSDETNGKKTKRNLEPSALGFSLDKVQDVEDDDLPDFANRNSKYAQYFAALTDSYTRAKWKKVDGIVDPDGLASALRNSAMRQGMGLEVKVMKDVNGVPTGEVYFFARTKKENEETAPSE